MGAGAVAPRIVSVSAGKHSMRTPAHERRLSQSAETRPCFTTTWIGKRAASDSCAASKYEVGRVPVTVSSSPNATLAEYLTDPPEYSLNPGAIRAVAEVIAEMTRSSPPDLDFRSMDAIRPYVVARAKDMLYSKLKGEFERSSARDMCSVEHLAEIVTKYTVGYGVLETLIEDPAVQDIYVNAPSSQTPVFAVLRTDDGHGVGQKCRTNVFVGTDDLLGIVSRVKLETGLPFSEANPVLEADISRLGCRLTLVGPPISDRGVSLAVRKHATRVLTLPALIRRDTLSPLLSSFLWSCVLGRRAVLVAGSRGAGKTTLLGSMLMEFPLTQRMLLIEDTPEIPARRLRQLGYDIVSLRFGEEGSLATASAEDALRVSLRMGESAIVIGEVRGLEAKVLYESMRAGSAGSSVLGTIHGNSAKGVLDRAVEDLGVSERAFSSTDLVVVIGLIRAPDGSCMSRKVVEVAEVRHGSGETELVKLFSMNDSRTFAEPTTHFDTSSKTVSGISEALGITPQRLMATIRLKAICDRKMAQSQEARWKEGCEHDRVRVLSNEMIVKGAFGNDDPEESARAWEAWYDSLDP